MLIHKFGTQLGNSNAPSQSITEIFHNKGYANYTVKNKMEKKRNYTK